MRSPGLDYSSCHVHTCYAIAIDLSWKPHVSADTAACVVGLADPTMATCNSDGTNDTVSPNYTCATNYFPTAAPVYCASMY